MPRKKFWKPTKSNGKKGARAKKNPQNVNPEVEAINVDPVVEEETPATAESNPLNVHPEAEEKTDAISERGPKKMQSEVEEKSDAATENRPMNVNPEVKEISVDTEVKEETDTTAESNPVNVHAEVEAMNVDPVVEEGTDATTGSNPVNVHPKAEEKDTMAVRNPKKVHFKVEEKTDAMAEMNPKAYPAIKQEMNKIICETLCSIDQIPTTRRIQPFLYPQPPEELNHTISTPIEPHPAYSEIVGLEPDLLEVLGTASLTADTGDVRAAATIAPPSSPVGSPGPIPAADTWEDMGAAATANAVGHINKLCEMEPPPSVPWRPPRRLCRSHQVERPRSDRRWERPVTPPAIDLTKKERALMSVLDELDKLSAKVKRTDTDNLINQWLDFSTIDTKSLRITPPPPYPDTVEEEAKKAEEARAEEAEKAEEVKRIEEAKWAKLNAKWAKVIQKVDAAKEARKAKKDAENAEKGAICKRPSMLEMQIRYVRMRWWRCAFHLLNLMHSCCRWGIEQPQSEFWLSDEYQRKRAIFDTTVNECLEHEDYGRLFPFLNEYLGGFKELLTDHIPGDASEEMLEELTKKEEKCEELLEELQTEYLKMLDLKEGYKDKNCEAFEVAKVWIKELTLIIVRTLAKFETCMKNLHRGLIIWDED